MMREGPVWNIGPSAIYRQDALLEAGGLDPTVGPLADIYLMQVVARRYGACFTPQLAVNYLINPNTYSGSTSLRQRLRFGKRMTQWMRAAPDLFPERFVRSWWSRYCRWACKHHLAGFLQRKLSWIAPFAKRAYRLLAG